MGRVNSDMNQSNAVTAMCQSSPMQAILHQRHIMCMCLAASQPISVSVLSTLMVLRAPEHSVMTVSGAEKRDTSRECFISCVCKKAPLTFIPAIGKHCTHVTKYLLPTWIHLHVSWRCQLFFQVQVFDSPEAIVSMVWPRKIEAT